MAKKIDNAILDELLKGCDQPRDLMSDGDLMKDLRKALMQRMLGAELTEHLGYEHGETAPPVQTNRRNGVSRKTLKSEDGAFELEVPRDREGSFEPRLIGKGQTRIDGLDEKIIAMYARGMSVRDIRGHLEELYGLEVSPDLISRVTDAVLDEVKEWRSRALDAVYPVVIFDALRVKIRDKDSRIVKNKAVYLALGITGEGEREVLGLWIAESWRGQDLIRGIKSPDNGAKFWLSVMTELRNRGVQDILIAVVDGLKGFPEAITAAFPETMVQTCVVHLVRHSLNFCSWKDRKAVAAKLREVYVAETAEAAWDALDAFDADWGRQYPSIAQAWRRAWQEVIPFFAFSPEIRRVIYTTNAIESLNRIIRKAIKTRGSFPSEEAAEKLIYLAIRGHEKTSRTVRGWLTAVNQFAIMFEDRFKPIQG